MSKTLGNVNRILRFSMVDGPGNRYVIFLQGCNFNCINCHNPHTIGLCDFCGICVDECPAQALTIDVSPTRVNFAESRCMHCDHCLTVCPRNSNPRTRWIAVEDILQELRLVEPFLSGVTVSGGEATGQADFVHDLFTVIKADAQLQHLTTFIDSNGAAPLAVWEELLPITDGVMLDLKALDQETHKTLTGMSNEAVLRSIAYLFQQDKLFEIRYLVIPGYNDSDEQIEQLAEYLKTLNLALRVKLNAFRLHGVREEFKDALREPQPEEIQRVKQILLDFGFLNIAL